MVQFQRLEGVLPAKLEIVCSGPSAEFVMKNRSMDSLEDLGSCFECVLS